MKTTGRITTVYLPRAKNINKYERKNMVLVIAGLKDVSFIDKFLLSVQPMHLIDHKLLKMSSHGAN